ncbi:SUKH-4 family immunity protein [Streptomyces sp. NPDC002133]|uniref:SUKH-4 family immunity protein n=1 Tax=Streptomyces sp. NPDC002133 TaxID=3154409 RepID=UPI0033226928
MDKVAQRALEDLLTRDLDAVVGPPPEVARPGDAVRAWRLPAGDIDALVRWGLPVTHPVGAATHSPTADFQDAADPALTLADGARAYRLASSWLRDYGAIAKAGGVFGVPRPGNTTGGLVNTSVTAYVETVWRWTRFCDLVDPLEESEEYETFHWCLDRFAAWAVARDPEAKSRSATGTSWWEDLALS